MMVSSSAAPPVIPKDESEALSITAAKEDLTYNSEDDLDYHPEEEEEDDDDLEYIEDTDEDDEDDEDEDDNEIDGVFDKSKKDGICSSSSSVSFEEPHQDKYGVHDIQSKLESNLNLAAHQKFHAFIHKHEIPRKFLHVSIGFITLYFYTQNLNTQIFVPYLSTACAVIFSLDLARFRIPEFNKAYCNTVGFLMREKEVNSYNGVIWYLLGLSIAFKPFPKDIGVMAVLLLSWSDTAASTIGRAYGYLTPKIARNKSLAGSLAAFITGTLSCLLFYGYFVPTFKFTDDILWSKETSRLNLITYSIACGFIAALSEGIDILNWDDNFTIPTLSSMFLFSLVKTAEIR